MSLQLTGIHHLTAVTADIRANHEFYTQVLGMRLVKRTVNQDDVRAYHLFYADEAATPGTDVTFFDWRVPREKRGTRSIVRTGLRVNGEQALRYWQERLHQKNASPGEVFEQDGRLTLEFTDPEGQRLALIDDGGAPPHGVPWKQSPVNAECQIRGLGPITLSVPILESTADLLVRVMQLRPVRTYAQVPHTVHVFEMGEGGAHAEIHVVVQSDVATASPGAGGVHHVAFRTPDEAQYHLWHQRLNELRVPNSGEVDRYYFRSLYFREPNGILFEIATDGPGFAVDENAATLGESLALPPFLEPRRAQIEASLRPIE